MTLRKFLGFPFTRLLGKGKPHFPLSPMLLPQPLTQGFSVDVCLLTNRSDEQGNSLPDCFRAWIRDHNCNPPMQMGLHSPGMVDRWNDEERRRALDLLYTNVAYVLRQRQFPKDTLIYDQAVTVHGQKLTNPRYPI